MNHFTSGDSVTPLTGKYKGKVGYVSCYISKHKLSDQKRVQVRVQTGIGWVTLLLNENNVKLIKQEAK